MTLFEIGFVSVRLIDLLDILLVGLLIFSLQRLFKRGFFLQLLLAFLGLILIWRTVELLDMELLSAIFREVARYGALGVLILFAPQIRRGLAQIEFGRNPLMERFRRQLTGTATSEATEQQIISAVTYLADNRTGAIIVLMGDNELQKVRSSGDSIQAEVSKRLLESIFNIRSPLHDGAVLIKDNKILAARCVLPISDDPDIPPELGLRHRSALGVSEISDALAIIVSEETGKVSVAEGGRLKRNLSEEELKQFLKGRRETA